MIGHLLAAGQFSADAVFLESNGIIPGAGHFGCVVKGRAVAICHGLVLFAGLKPNFTDIGHHEHVGQVGYTGAGQVGMAKAHDAAVGVVIPAAPVPTFVIRIGGYLYKPERQGSTGKGMAMTARTDKRVNPSDRVIGWLSERVRATKTGQKNKNNRPAPEGCVQTLAKKTITLHKKAVKNHESKQIDYLDNPIQKRPFGRCDPLLDPAFHRPGAWWIFHLPEPRRYCF